MTGAICRHWLFGESSQSFKRNWKIFFKKNYVRHITSIEQRNNGRLGRKSSPWETRTKFVVYLLGSRDICVLHTADTKHKEAEYFIGFSNVEKWIEETSRSRDPFKK